MKFSKKRFYVVKGVGMGFFIWVFTLGIATLYKMPLFAVVPLNAAYVMLGGAAVWGLVTALVYKYFDSKVDNNSISSQEQRITNRRIFHMYKHDEKEKSGVHLTKPKKLQP